MDGSSNTAEYTNSAKAGAEKAGCEPASANCSGEVLRDIIGRNVMAWINAGTVQHSEAESGRDLTLKARFH